MFAQHLSFWNSCHYGLKTIMSPAAGASCLWLQCAEQTVPSQGGESGRRSERGRQTCRKRRRSHASVLAAELLWCPGRLLMMNPLLKEPSDKKKYTISHVYPLWKEKFYTHHRGAGLSCKRKEKKKVAWILISSQPNQASWRSVDWNIVDLNVFVVWSVQATFLAFVLASFIIKPVLILLSALAECSPGRCPAGCLTGSQCEFSSAACQFHHYHSAPEGKQTKWR